ncbi:MAG: DUF418 domain-containing protein [Propionibacteriaceae bacterium]|nr:DUF418 domain-containing protein [Propionibacteriaceae bacterium]
MLETAAPMAPDVTRPVRSPRLLWLDVLRGFALCGIIFANIPTMFWLQDAIVDGVVQPTRGVLDLWVQGRFFPIFSWLFGLGFGLMWRSAQRRAANPRRALAQRIGVLAILGGAHQLLQPGEALLPYAVVALVVLLPSTWLPRWLLLAAGLVATAVAAQYGDLVLIPGLFLVGFGAAQYGLPGFLERRPWVGAVALVGLVPAAWASAQWQLADPVSARFGSAGAVTGLLMAAAYAATIVALLGVPGVRDALRVVFQPLGRMALTNYVTASVLMFGLNLLRPVLGVPTEGEAFWQVAMAIAAGILVVQWACSVLWLRFHPQGAVAGVWRRRSWWVTGRGLGGCGAVAGVGRRLSSAGAAPVLGGCGAGRRR